MLANMEEAFTEAHTYEQRPISAELKIAYWQRFLEGFGLQRIEGVVVIAGFYPLYLTALHFLGTSPPAPLLQGEGVGGEVK